jgi:hypothetical protein
MGLVVLLGGAAGCRKESPMTTAAKNFNPAEKEVFVSSRGSKIAGRSDLLSRENVNNLELHLGLIHEDFQRYTEDLARSIKECDESPEALRRKMTQLALRLAEVLSTKETIQLIEGTCKGGLKAYVYNDVLQRYWYDSPERLREALRMMSPSVYRENGYEILNLRSASTPENLDKALDDYLMLTDEHDIRGALDGLADAKYNLIILSRIRICEIRRTGN